VRSALEIVGDNALLHATEGLIHWMRVNSGITPDETRLVRAEECVRRALALDPDCAQAIFVRGIVSGSRGRVEEALSDLLTPHAHNPGDANVLTELSRFLFSAGQADAFCAVTNALARIDPLTPVTSLCVLAMHLSEGRVDEAARVAREMQPLLDPVSPMWVWSAWQGLHAGGRSVEARGVLARYADRAVAGPFHSLARFFVAAIDRDPDAAREHMAAVLEQATSRQEHLARVVGEAYAQLGNTDEALRWLRVSVDLGMINYPFLSRTDVFLEPIRRDPRFHSLMDAVKRRWEAFPPVQIHL
jgi:tetratricopeptide (TPR) repeat protein